MLNANKIYYTIISVVFIQYYVLQCYLNKKNYIIKSGVSYKY